MAVTIDSYADVQNVLAALVSANQLPIGQAPHQAFFQTLSYDEFVNGNVPNVAGFKILEIGNSQQSNIIQALSGTPNSPFDPNSGSIGQMPQPNPPYNANTPAQSDVITALAAWIDKGCPQFAAAAEEQVEPVRLAAPPEGAAPTY